MCMCYIHASFGLTVFPLHPQPRPSPASQSPSTTLQSVSTVRPNVSLCYVWHLTLLTLSLQPPKTVSYRSSHVSSLSKHFQLSYMLYNSHVHTIIVCFACTYSPCSWTLPLLHIVRHWLYFILISDTATNRWCVTFHVRTSTCPIAPSSLCSHLTYQLKTRTMAIGR